jgi:hypothetical protein
MIFRPMQIPNQTNGHGPEFQLEGEIIYYTGPHCPSGTEEVKHSRYFAVARKGAQWKIRTTNINSDRFAYGNAYHEMGCDGTQIYEVKHLDENTPEISNVKDIITTQARVRLGNAPVGFGLDFFYPLWIAYCSSGYFVTRQNNRIAAPLFIIGDSLLDIVPPTLCLPAKWKLNDSNFISEIAWQSEGKELAVENGTNKRLQYSLRTLPPPFDSGFLRASFETTDWVDFNGIHLPGNFTVKIFFPDQITGKIDVSYAVDAKIQSVNPLQDFSFLPELRKKTRITDTRYSLCAPCSGHPTYAGSVWMTEEEVEAKNKSFGIKYEKQNL